MGSPRLCPGAEGEAEMLPYTMIFTRKISAGLYPSNKRTQAAPSQRQSKQAASVLKSQLSLHEAERLSFGQG